MDTLQPICDELLVDDVQYSLRHLWGMSTITSNRKPFRVPCTNPCSIMRDQLRGLSEKVYKVGEKTDGVRFYLLASFYSDPRQGDEGQEEEYAVLVNRAGHMYRVDMSGPADLFAGTLLDGELCVHDDNLTFVVFDAVACNGYTVRHQTHSMRIQTAESVMSAMVTPSLTLTLKTWYPLAEAVNVWMRAKENCDGLILVPEQRPLEYGTQPDLFKWKPGNSHTLDLIFNGRYLYAWGDDDCKHIVADLHDCVFHPDASSVPVNQVCEFALIPDSEVKQRWIVKLVKTREDKLHPNSLLVVELTIKNIQENILVEELIQ